MDEDQPHTSALLRSDLSVPMPRLPHLYHKRSVDELENDFVSQLDELSSSFPEDVVGSFRRRKRDTPLPPQHVIGKSPNVIHYTVSLWFWYSVPVCHSIIRFALSVLGNWPNLPTPPTPSPAFNSLLQVNYKDYKGAEDWLSPPFSSIVYRSSDVQKSFFLLLLVVILGEFFSCPAITLADSAVSWPLTRAKYCVVLYWIIKYLVH